MKTTTPEEKVIITTNITQRGNKSVIRDEKNGRNKLSLRPVKSLTRKSVRPMNFFANSKKEQIAPL